ncbi:polyamine ABC transporter substrate-binding protein [Cognaticolwellia beringensis]|uniref:Putrescine-binding periplasmic protein n=1 Tax=Cognaticolwellia beringensis TaxID=1967665 RepID=A0A222G4P2_9GAMM|nr:spermidine/putrescine ABC transporter substrate-binding protein [Cognaticolwellia beringensis]ASP46761.1 hypothetical protein B5D82_02560 [Cognaticolwellia beringensis]
MVRQHSKHKLTSLITLCLIAYSLLTSSVFAQKNIPTLTILNWSEYIDPSIVSAFETEFNVKIVDVYYETDDARDKFLNQTNGIGYDVGIVSGMMMQIYSNKGWIDSISTQDVPNLKYIDDKIRNSHQGTYGYSVPYTWGTMGIAYRSDLVEKPIETWMDLFQPQASLKGKIVMIKGARELLGAALNAKGYSINSMDKKELAEAESLLLAQKPHVLKYGYIQLTTESILIRGAAAATIAYGGDALTLSKLDPNVKYVLPKEGSSIWTDHWVVFSQSKNKQLAYKFLNFMNEPKNAAKNAEFIYMATPNIAAKEFLSPEFLSDSIIHPSAEQLKTLEPHLKLQGRMLRTRSKIYNKVIN